MADQCNSFKKVNAHESPFYGKTDRLTNWQIKFQSRVCHFLGLPISVFYERKSTCWNFWKRKRTKKSETRLEFSIQRKFEENLRGMKFSSQFSPFYTNWWILLSKNQAELKKLKIIWNFAVYNRCNSDLLVSQKDEKRWHFLKKKTKDAMEIFLKV